MKKIGIITLNGYFNYGNRLQNYALQEVLKSQNCIVETIRVSNHEIPFSTKIMIKTKQTIKKFLATPRSIRTKRFYNFSKKYINETNYEISEVSIPKEISDFDYFVTGSDQVWNPAFNFLSSVYFLDFAPRQKRISYAASFGISDIPNEHTQDYKRWLLGMNHISVREEAGRKIVEELTEQEAEIVLDPTLMLSKEQWLSISKESLNKPKKQYLLTYFLGEVSPKVESEINKISNERDLEIVNLATIKDKKAFIADPSEFIDYINSASVLLTDSFHGAVFSILLDTPFVVYNREGSLSPMNSRIDTLTSKFKLESRKAENIETIDQIFNTDYAHVEPILNEERKKSLGFLKTALDIK